MRDGRRTKELIARTALSLFVEKGITETTVRDIAGAAGLAEGTLYRHFASKEDLAWNLFSTHYTAFARELEEVQAAHEALRAKLEAMIRQFCTFFDEDPVLFSYLLLAQHAQLKKVTPEMPSPVAVLRQVLAEGIARGEVPRTDPEMATALVLGVVLQVAVFKVYGHIPESLASLADPLMAACWRVLAGRA
jgi:AcrR family transcriptional regulator